jgi:hypothetical protein
VKLWDELVQEFMPLTPESLLKKRSRISTKAGIFQTVSATFDGITFSPISGSAHFSYQKLYSDLLQGVADAGKRFLIIEVGENGKQSDGGTSQFFALLEKNEFNVPPDQHVPRTSMKAPNVLIGDEAYHSKEYLMRPYPRRVRTPQWGRFNKHVSDIPKVRRMCIWNLRIYPKWLVLSKCLETYIEGVCFIVQCAGQLCNLMIDGDFDDSDLTDYTVT